MSSMTSRETENSRRTFLRSAGVIVAGIPLWPMVQCEKADNDDLVKECATTEDILGPYYRAGAPELDDIVPADSDGTILAIEGVVSSGCANPLTDAWVEIWNADENGDYDMSDAFRFRGSQRSGQNGHYAFRTIIPGRYLNGSTFRPSHIHFRITAAGHKELVTQIYFTDDPYLASDPWASADGAQDRILNVTDRGGISVVTFDIKLSQA